MSIEFKFIQYFLISIVVSVSLLILSNSYANYENRKAYFKCLELVERISIQKNNNDTTVRIVSLPTCYYR